MSAQVSKNSEWDPLVSGERQLVATDFWAPLCPHCSVSVPVFESVLPTEQDTKFVRVNIDQIPAIASKNYRTQGVYLLSSFSVRAKRLENCWLHSKRQL